MASDESDLIIPTDCVRDLVVMEDYKLNFKSHVDFVYRKAKIRIIILLRAFNLRSKELLIFA